MENNPVYILLPICDELEHDVFLNLLRNIVGRVGRSRLADHYLDNAFKSGMEEDFVVAEDDVTLSWKNSESRSKRTRHAKLIGYWTAVNCPILCKAFFGNSWLPSKGSVVKVESRNGIKTMTAAEIDKIIFPKMKCNVAELHVCDSTLANLKHFVKVPINEIELSNGRQITSRIRSYDINQEFMLMEKCWASLKHGEWLKNNNTEVRRTVLYLRVFHSVEVFPLSIARTSSND